MASIVKIMISKTHQFAPTTRRNVSLVLFISLVISSLIATSHQTQAAILSSPQSASLSTAAQISNDPSQISQVAANAGGGPKSSPSQDQSAGLTAEMAGQMSNSIGLAPASLNQVSQHHQMAGGQAQQVGGGSAPSSAGAPNQPLVLPRVNIFASKSEIKKLLGLATQINYIENGILNSYALGFQIPMGYALSDMIFTWQNLGPTNVNYSISLVIGNVYAVERPLINITRSGLIPRHEQVFKITLPCSGKVNDEVDVQILFNISGLVPVAPTEAAGDNLFGSAASSDEAGGEFQLTRAVQQQNEMLAAAVAANGNGQQQQQQQPASDQMQADQQDQKRPQMRMVSHTLAIKRKKICTLDPVPVHPVPKQPEVRPPNQTPNRDMVRAPSPVPAFADPKGDQQPTANDLKVSPVPPVAEPSHQPAWTEAPPPPSLQPQSPGLPPPHTPLTGGAAKVKPTMPSPPPPISNPDKFVQEHTQELSHNWPLDRQLPPAPATSSRPISPADASISLIDTPRQQQQAPASNSLLFSLIVMSLIVSVALIALLILGSTSHSSDRFGSAPRRSSPLDKLTALTNCIWRRTSAGSRAVNKCGKNAAGPITIKSGLIGTFGSSLSGGHNSAAHHHQHHHQHHHHGAKSNVSSISGLSTISAGLTSKQQNQNLMGPFCHAKQTTNYNSAGLYHHYQQPPDLLIGSLINGGNSATTANNFHHSPPSLTSPYQITMNNNQMTKLFLASPQNGGTYSIDNNYMPIVPATNNFQAAAHSDSGSVYQTIY